MIIRGVEVTGRNDTQKKKEVLLGRNEIET
jgi:hypothetical protein